MRVHASKSLPPLVEVSGMETIALHERRVVPITVRRKGSPELLVWRRKLKACRHDANDLIVGAINLQRLAQDITRFGKAPRPKPMAEKKDFLATGFLFRSEEAS